GGPLLVVTHDSVDLGDLPGQVAVARVDVPRNERELDPVLMVVALQLLAYHAALALGHDIDKPRNLAKSVTVE
ncbi:MAG TPA: glutamine--fructose-6-phosphate aminotransferase, partial [Nocardioides sp.]|nr:glutamine--fructose-6-phosphate aminotransferase [Nocardioides sp.]